MVRFKIHKKLSYTLVDEHKENVVLMKEKFNVIELVLQRIC